MVKLERRTRGDIVAASAIVVIVAVAAGLIWWTSDARATISRPAAAPVPYLTPAREVPAGLRQLWATPSPATTVPVIAGGSVVTGEGRTVTGRDPVVGAALWSYARDVDLCGVTSVYQYAVAVYPDSRGCGQVSTIDGKTGNRGPARTAYADPEVRLSTDGTTVLSAGDSRLELWRSDMVRMLSWGAIDARIKPDVPASPLCRQVSAAASSSAVSVLEACPKQNDLRLTLLRPADEEDTPDVRNVDLPGVTDDSGAQVIAVTDTTTAVYVPTPKPTVNVIDETGTTVASTLLPKPAAPQSIATKTGDLVTWWTGDSVLVFDASGLRYKYTVAPAGPHLPVGPGTVMAGRLLVPVNDGYDVFDPATGKGERHIPLSRPPSVSPVVPTPAGSTLSSSVAPNWSRWVPPEARPDRRKCRSGAGAATLSSNSRVDRGKSPDIDDDDAGVVAAAGLVGDLDEAARRGFRLGHGGRGENVGLRRGREQPVGADEQPVAGPAVDVDDVQPKLRTDPQRPGEQMPLRVGPGLGARDLPHPHKFTGHAVIVGELHHLPLPDPVQRGIADVDGHGAALLGRQHRNRGQGGP